MVEQGDIVKTAGIEQPLLVVSSNAYNKAGTMIVCPIVKAAGNETLRVFVETKQISGHVLCDDMKRLDLKTRGFTVKGNVGIAKMIIILDMIQSLFAYV